MSEGDCLKELLANTYDLTPSGWERVKEYEEVMRYSSTNPSKGSTAIATAMEISRGRIRPWLDGKSRPDPVKAIEVAESNGWVPFDWDTVPTPQISAIAAWIYAGGGIDSQYVPHFTIDNEEQAELLEQGLEEIDIGFERRHEADEHRATELVLSENGTILGRLLVGLGVPQGVKGENHPISLPDYLEKAPAHIREDFVRTYVFVRGSANPDRPNWPIQLRESRKPEFTQSIKKLIRAVVGDSEAVTGADDAATVYLSEEAADQLNCAPKAFR